MVTSSRLATSSRAQKSQAPAAVVVIKIRGHPILLRSRRPLILRSSMDLLSLRGPNDHSSVIIVLPPGIEHLAGYLAYFLAIPSLC
jgi:hypothetical protein